MVNSFHGSPKPIFDPLLMPKNCTNTFPSITYSVRFVCSFPRLQTWWETDSFTNSASLTFTLPNLNSDLTIVSQPSILPSVPVMYPLFSKCYYYTLSTYNSGDYVFQPRLGCSTGICYITFSEQTLHHPANFSFLLAFSGPYITTPSSSSPKIKTSFASFVPFPKDIKSLLGMGSLHITLFG